MKHPVYVVSRATLCTKLKVTCFENDIFLGGEGEVPEEAGIVLTT